MTFLQETQEGLCTQCAKLLLSCPSLCDPMDYSPPGSAVHGILQARILQHVVIALLQGILLTEVWNLGLQQCRQILYHVSHQGSPRKFKEPNKRSMILGVTAGDIQGLSWHLAVMPWGQPLCQAPEVSVGLPRRGGVSFQPPLAAA